MNFSMLAQPIGSLKLMPKLVYMINIQARELYLSAFIKLTECTFNTGLQWDAWEPLCYKLGMLLDTTKLDLQYDSSLSDIDL